MKKLLIILTSISAFAFNGNGLLTFESGNHGDTASAALLDSTTIGTMPGAWTLTGDAGVINTNWNFSLFVPMMFNGVEYRGQGSRVLEIDRGSEQQYQWQFPSGARTNDFTVGFWFWCTGGRSGNFDLLSIEGAFPNGESSTFQLLGTGFIPHGDTGDGEGPPIDIDESIPHWFVLVHRKAVGITLYAYDTNQTKVGESFQEQTATSTNGVRFFGFGNVNPHDDFPVGKLFWDSLTFKWGAFPDLKPPVGIPNIIHVSTSGSDSNTGTNLSSSLASIDFAVDSKATNSDNRILLHPGTYNTAINLTRSGTPGDKIWIYAEETNTVFITTPITFNGLSNICFLNITFLGDGSGAADQALRLEAADRLEVWNCTFTNFFDVAIFCDVGDWVNNSIFHGNRFYGSHTIGDAHASIVGTNNVFQYYYMNKANEDYIYYAGQYIIFRNGFADDPDSDSLAHVDKFQVGAGLSSIPNNNFITIESQLYYDSTIAGNDHHLGNWSNNADSDAYGDMIIRRTLTYNIGTVLVNIFQDSSGAQWNTNISFYNNTFIRANRYSDAVNENTAGSIENGANIYNNIGYDLWGINVTNPDIWSSSNGDILSDFNFYFDSDDTISLTGEAADETNAVINEDPDFGNVGTLDFTLQGSSPAIDAGGTMTTVTSANNTGATFSVGSGAYFRGDNTNLFQYNGNILVGDIITIGTDVRQVVSINGNSITVSTNFTWTQGDSVYWETDTTPDIGAYPANYVALSTAEIDGNSVTPNSVMDTRFVIAFSNGIPIIIDNLSPYNDFEDIWGEVEYWVYPLYPSSTTELGILAGAEAPESSTYQTKQVGVTLKGVTIR